MRCNCGVCRSTDPRDKRLRCSALLECGEGRNILIDCSPDFRQQMLALDCPPIEGCIITHTHYDHVGGIDDLRPYCASGPESGFPIFCRDDVAADLKSRIPYCFSEHPYPGVPRLNLITAKESVPFTVAGAEVLPLPVMHGKLPILGYRIENLGYITDALTIPGETIESLKGVDTLVINALRQKPHPSHQTLSDALSAIEKINPRQAFLTHMSHDMPAHADFRKLLPTGVYAAYDGMEVLF